MPLMPRATIDPTTATNNWGAGVSNGAAKWADGYAHPKRNPFDPSVINPDAWQNGVSTPQAKTRYASKLAAVNQDVVLTTVNGVGKQKFAAAGTNKKGNVQTFMSNFLPKVASSLSQLNSQNPKGPRGSNIQRAVAWATLMAATRGTNN